MGLAFECFLTSHGTLVRHLPRAVLRFCQIALRLVSCARRRSSRFGSSELHSRSACFRQPNRDCLLSIACAVLATANVFHFFMHEFASLRTRGFSFLFIFLGALQRSLPGHASPLHSHDAGEQILDVSGKEEGPASARPASIDHVFMPMRRLILHRRLGTREWRLSNVRSHSRCFSRPRYSSSLRKLFLPASRTPVRHPPTSRDRRGRR